MKKKTHIPACFLKPLLGLSLLAVLASPVCAAEGGMPAAAPPSAGFENTYVMPVVWRDLYAKVRQYTTENNLPELEQTYILGSKIDGNAISFPYLFGYECSDEASYIVSPDGIYEIYTDENWNAESTQAIDLGDRGIYTTYGADTVSYEYAGFPCMPDLYYSLAANGDCYLNQRDLGYPYGCCPTSLSMAMMLSGEMDFDREGFFRALARQGYRFQTAGITLPDALHYLDLFADLPDSYLYREYNPFVWMEAVLEGRPVVICIENGLDLADGNFVKPAPQYMNGYHAELITGFFVCDGRLGFELYDPDPIGWTGQGVLIWESDLWALCRNEARGNFFSAISFRLKELDKPAETPELTLREKGTLTLMYRTRASCAEIRTFEGAPRLVDTANEFILVS